MRDPNLKMDRNLTGQRHPAMVHDMESRKSQNKAVRVAFGPGLDTYIPPRDESPAPALEPPRPLASVGQSLDPGSKHPRPTSSLGENTKVPEPVLDRLSDRTLGNGRPTVALQRSKSDYGPRAEVDKSSFGEDDDFAMRHGWQEEYTSSEYLKILHSVSLECPPPPCQPSIGSIRSLESY
jgi:regulatory associated protein of mTOR